MLRLSVLKEEGTSYCHVTHGNVHATLRVVGESALRVVATIRSESRGGNIFLDVVSL